MNFYFHTNFINILVIIQINSFKFIQIKVNDTPLENVTHEDAVAALKATQEYVRLLVKKRPNYDHIGPEQYVSG